MSAHKTYTEADRAYAIKEYKEGRGCKWISEIVGCSTSTIKRWVDESGIEKHPASDYSKEFREKVITEYRIRKDLSLHKVAKNNGIYHHTLRRWLRDAGVVTRSSRPLIIGREGILEDLKAGLPKKEIAKRHSCSVRWVYRVQAGD